MSENEFELYLSLLSRFLRLKPDQRLEISDELRDHLDARLADLVAQGLSREQAVRQALEEFGDAASLAEHFTHLAQARKRRLIMRCTLGTIGATAAAILLVMALWPVDRAVQGPNLAAADQRAATEAVGSPQDARRAEVERLLDSTTLTVDFGDVPLADVLEFLSEKLEVDTVVSPSVSRESPITLHTITLHINRKAVSARTVLDLALEQAAAGYTVRDGIIYVSEQGLVYDLQVYNVRDILSDFPLPKPALGAETAPAETDPPPTPAQSLVSVITGTVNPMSWNDVGGQASIKQFNGLLVIKQNQQAHREIRQLLQLLETNRAKSR